MLRRQEMLKCLLYLIKEECEKIIDEKKLARTSMEAVGGSAKRVPAIFLSHQDNSATS